MDGRFEYSQFARARAGPRLNRWKKAREGVSPRRIGPDFIKGGDIVIQSDPGVELEHLYYGVSAAWKCSLATKYR